MNKKCKCAPEGKIKCATDSCDKNKSKDTNNILSTLEEARGGFWAGHVHFAELKSKFGMAIMRDNFNLINQKIIDLGGEGIVLPDLELYLDPVSSVGEKT